MISGYFFSYGLVDFYSQYNRFRFTHADQLVGSIFCPERPLEENSSTFAECLFSRDSDISTLHDATIRYRPLLCY